MRIFVMAVTSFWTAPAYAPDHPRAIDALVETRRRRTMNVKSILTIAIAAATIAVGSLATTGEASAKKGFHGGRHGGFHGHFHRGHRWGHRWHGHRWHKRFYYAAPAYYGYANPCYFARKPSGRVVKVCPVY